MSDYFRLNTHAIVTDGKELFTTTQKQTIKAKGKEGGEDIEISITDYTLDGTLEDIFVKAVKHIAVVLTAVKLGDQFGKDDELNKQTISDFYKLIQ